MPSDAAPSRRRHRGASHALFRHRRDRLHRSIPCRTTAGAAGNRLRSGAQELARQACVAARVLERRRAPGGADHRRPRQAAPRRVRCRRAQAQGQGPALLPSRGDLRSRRERGGPDGRERRRHAARGRVRRSHAGRLLPSRELHRGSGTLRRRVPRGHVRGSRGARPSLLPHQARGRGHRAARMPAAVSHLSSRLRRRAFEDRLHRQDRWPVLLLQAHPEAAQGPAAVDADDRHRRRAHQHRAGGFRRRCARPHRPQEGARRQDIPPDGSRTTPYRRSAQHLRACRACAADDDAPQRAHVRLHPGADPLRSGIAVAREAHVASGAHRPGHSARRVPVRQLADALRQSRGDEGAEGLGHQRAARRRPMPRNCGTTGSATSIRTSSSTARCRGA